VQHLGKDGGGGPDVSEVIPCGDLRPRDLPLLLAIVAVSLGMRL
jgi:hypothetical protein